MDFTFFHADTVLVSDVTIEADNYVRLGVDTATPADDGWRSVDFGRLPTSTASAADSGFRSVEFARVGASVTSSVTDSGSRAHAAERVAAEDVFADDGLE